MTNEKRYMSTPTKHEATKLVRMVACDKKTQNTKSNIFFDSMVKWGHLIVLYFCFPEPYGHYTWRGDSSWEEGTTHKSQATNEMCHVFISSKLITTRFEIMMAYDKQPWPTKLNDSVITWSYGVTWKQKLYARIKFIYSLGSKIRLLMLYLEINWSLFFAGMTDHREA